MSFEVIEGCESIEWLERVYRVNRRVFSHFLRRTIQGNYPALFKFYSGKTIQPMTSMTFLKICDFFDDE